MPTHIEHIVTEVIPEPETNTAGANADQRWRDYMKIQALLKQTERMRLRLNAEGFDD